MKDTIEVAIEVGAEREEGTVKAEAKEKK